MLLAVLYVLNIDIFHVKSIGKEDLNVFIIGRFIEEDEFFLGFSKEVHKEIEMVYKKSSLKISQYLQDNTYVRVCFNKVARLQACNFIKEAQTQVFSCEYCEIFKNTFFIEHLREDCFWKYSRVVTNLFFVRSITKQLPWRLM